VRRRDALPGGERRGPAAVSRLWNRAGPNQISGMPVHHKFAYPGEEAAQAARRALGLDPEKFTVFVNAGWEGGGNIPQIFASWFRGELEVQGDFPGGSK